MANNNVIYLPAGVTAPAPSGPQAGVPSGIPFDRRFFESILPQSIGAFCSQTDCSIPRVELLTIDGVTHFVSGIIGVHDSWVALQIAKEEHRHPIQVFIPYQSIFRVEVHPESERRRHIGFITEPSTEAGHQLLTEPAELAAADAAPVEPAAEAPAPPATETVTTEAPEKAPRRGPRKVAAEADSSAIPAATSDALKTPATRRAPRPKAT